MELIDFIKKYQKADVTEVPNRVPSSVEVSVLVTTYNHEKYLRTCLDSTLPQETTFSFELVFGEDSSTDSTQEICKEYAQRHPDKIRLLINSRANNIYINQSPSGRFNFLYSLNVARGKFIARCEGDDFWIDPKKLQMQFDLMSQHADHSLCFHAHRELDGKTGEEPAFCAPRIRKSGCL